MKIAGDVSDLSTSRADGTTRYTRELVKRLPGLDLDSQWEWHAPADFEGYSSPNSIKRISPWPRYWTQLRLPWELHRHRADVLFMPIQQLPLLRPSKIKTVAVVHDLAVHKFPRQFRRKDWLLLHAFSAQVAREADEVIAVSSATADDLDYYYGRSQRVSVVHHGIDRDYFREPGSDDERKSAWEEIRRWQPGIEEPYILFVGQIQPRKNISGLVEAYEALAKKDKDLQLVIGGGHGWLQEPILRRISASKFAKRIIVTGRVPDEILPSLYWHAQVFVLPSFYEGFGMPVLEAMACGTPVVTSNVSSLPEIAGAAAVLVDPNNVSELAIGIQSARENREQLKSAGRQQVQRFSWQRTAQATWDVIRSA